MTTNELREGLKQDLPSIIERCRWAFANGNKPLLPDLTRLSQAYLAALDEQERRARDDGEPLDWAWLGCPNATENKHLELGEGDNCITVYIGCATHPESRVGFCAVINKSPYMHAVRLETRGDVRRLCAALGIPLKETP